MLWVLRDSNCRHATLARDHVPTQWVGGGAGEEDRKSGVRCCLGEGEFYIGFVEKTNHSRQLVDDQQAGTCVVQATSSYPPWELWEFTWVFLVK